MINLRAVFSIVISSQCAHVLHSLKKLINAKEAQINKSHLASDSKIHKKFLVASFFGPGIEVQASLFLTKSAQPFLPTCRGDDMNHGACKNKTKNLIPLYFKSFFSLPTITITFSHPISWTAKSFKSFLGSLIKLLALSFAFPSEWFYYEWVPFQAFLM